MSRNRTTLAWAVVLLSFVTFCLIAIAGPVGVNYYRAQALKADSAQLEVIAGTAILQKRGSTQKTATTGSIVVEEGDSVRTTANSQAMLWLPGGSNVRLWPDALVKLEQLRTSRYNNNNALVHLRQYTGHSRVEVAMLLSKSRSFQIGTPDGRAIFREGSYSLDLRPGRTSVINHFGSATVESEGVSVELLQKERLLLVAGGPPSDPEPSAENLVGNGDFAGDLDGWQWGNREAEEPVLGAVTPMLADGLRAVRFLRTGATKHAETFLVQNVNRDVTDFQSLKLGLDLKLVHQSLSGGGWLGSEYPLMVRVKYRDVWGSEAIFRRGYFYQNKDRQPTANGEQVEHNVWIKTTEYDLFNRTITDPRPAHIISVELAASGWSFESMATKIRLIAE